MPARFAVGQGSAAQRTPSAPCQRQGSVIRRIKGNKSAFFRIPSQERSDTVQRTRPIVKDKATHPVHACVLPGQGSAVQRTSSAQEPFAKGMACDPASPCAHLAKGGATPPAAHPAPLAKDVATPSGAKSPYSKRKRHQKSDQGNTQLPVGSGTGRAPLKLPGRLRKTRRTEPGVPASCRVDNSPLRALQ